MPKISKEELLQYQEDIKRYYKYRRVLLLFGLLCLFGPSVVLLNVVIIIVAMGETTHPSPLIVTLFTIITISGIVLLILRSALFNQKIKNRKRIIDEAKEEYAIEKMYKETKD